jgi:hypothetical protein
MMFGGLVQQFRQCGDVSMGVGISDARAIEHYRSDSDWQDDSDVFRQIAASVFPG